MYHFAGLPTKEERLISGLGLGGSGQNYDLSEVDLGLSVIGIQINAFRKVNMSRFRRQADYGDGTRCPRTQSAGAVCQHLTGKTGCVIKFID